MVGSLIRLFPENATEFTSNGLGYLPDATSCTVEEERNGTYELTLKYPITGKRYKDLTRRKILVAKPNPYDGPQPFRIFSISKPFNGIVTFYAEHISYDMSGYPVAPFTSNTLSEALGKLKSNAILTYPFTFWTNVTVNNYFETTSPESVRSIIGGSSTSLIDAYGGEYEFDGYNVKIHNARGGDYGYTIRYGKNLTDLTQDEDNSKVYTGIYPYWYDSEKGLVEANPKVISTGVTFDQPKIYILDCSSDFVDPPSSADLTKLAQEYMADNNVIDPEVTCTVSFVALSKSKEYETLQILDKVKLCDLVTVEFEKMGITTKLKCVKTEYNVLTDRYDSITLGSPATSLAKTIVRNKESASTSLSTTNDNLNTKISNLDKEIHWTLEEHVTEIINDITTLERDFKTELDLTARGLRLEISEVNRTLTNDINTATEEFNNRIDATARNFTIELSEVNKSLTQDIIDNVAALDKKIADGDAALDSEITATVTEFNNRLELTARSFELELSEVNKTLTGKIDSTNKKLDDEITQTVSEFNTRITATARDLTAEINETRRDLSNEIDTTETQLRSEIKASSSQVLVTVEKTYSTKEEYKQMQSSLDITAEKVETKVTNGEISSSISQEAGEINITSDRFSLDSSHLEIKKNGDIWSTGYIRSTGAWTGNTYECVMQNARIDIVKNGSSVGHFSARPGHEGVEMYGDPMAAVWSSAGAGYICANPNSSGFAHHNTFYGSTNFTANVDLTGNGTLNIYNSNTLVGRLQPKGTSGATGMTITGYPMIQTYGELYTEGKITANGGLLVPGSSTFNSYATFNETTGFNAQANFTQNIRVDGLGDFNGGLSVSGESTFYSRVGINSTLSVTNETVTGNLSVNGYTYETNLNVSNNASVKGTFYAGTYEIWDNEIRSSTGWHACTSRAVYLHGTATYCVKEDTTTYTEIYASEFTKSSLSKWKTNFSDVTEEDALKILELRPQHFDYIHGKKNRAGFIAEEVEPIYPDTCSYVENEETGKMELFGIDYSSFVPYLVKMVQRQEREINELKAMVSLLLAERT